MNRLALTLQRAYRLTPKNCANGAIVSVVRIGAGGRSAIVPLPHAERLSYYIAPSGRAALTVESLDFEVEPLGPILSWATEARARLVRKRKKILHFPDFRIFAAGPKSARKIFSATTTRLMKSGAALDGPIVEKYPELLIGWQEEPRSGDERRIASGPSPRAIVVHIYYEETWAEIAAILHRLPHDFDLIVTTVPGRESLVADIRRAFPQAEIHVGENRGRDVRPFLALLEQGRFDRYRYVCKIHGKKSHDGGRKAVLGAVWRRRMLFDLIAAPGAVAAILDRFDREPDVGMIGSRAYRYPSPLCPEEWSWGENRPRVLAIAAKMGVSAERFQLDFFCGTMFWVRPEALRPLRELRLAEAFPRESGKLDGALEHAVERLLSAATVAAGYRIEGIDGFAAVAGEPRQEAR
jgi:hypothetical protein